MYKLLELSQNSIIIKSQKIGREAGIDPSYYS